jgi:hypothetical protein
MGNFIGRLFVQEQKNGALRHRFDIGEEQIDR